MTALEDNGFLAPSHLILLQFLAIHLHLLFSQHVFVNFLTTANKMFDGSVIMAHAAPL